MYVMLLSPKLEAFARLKLGKSDAEGVHSEHVTLASSALASPLAMFFTSLLRHGYLLEIVFSSLCRREIRISLAARMNSTKVQNPRRKTQVALLDSSGLSQACLYYTIMK